MNNTITIPTGVNFGNRSIKSQLARFKKRMDDLPSATYIKLKNGTYRLAGLASTTVGGKGLYDGYMDEFERGIHSPESICKVKQIEPGVFVEVSNGWYDTFVEQVLPLLPCHISLLSLTFAAVGGVVLLAPTRTQLILADLNDRVPKLVQQGVKTAKDLPNRAREGVQVAKTWASNFKLRRGS